MASRDAIYIDIYKKMDQGGSYAEVATPDRSLFINFKSKTPQFGDEIVRLLERDTTRMVILKLIRGDT